jgi:cyanophycinase-like exopeptidase
LNGKIQLDSLYFKTISRVRVFTYLQVYIMCIILNLMKKTIYTLLFVFLALNISAQKGYLLIIGGGPENISTTTSWNYEAFNWAVEKSTNKKVAILHYSTTPSGDFEDYFVDFCGATAVKSFVVDASNANSSTLINEINEYDVFYFRGGNQWVYYDEWRGKLIEDAIHSKFNNGGVLCGTSAGLAILSGVTFTAEYSSAYSNLCIKNTKHVAITLENNFLEVMPGYIFDSHFTHRGRLGRLVSFMAHWKNNKGEDLVGIGVDEISALAIDTNNIATAYGAGTIDIIRFDDETNFTPGELLDIEDLEYNKLVQGTSINLNDFSITGFENEIETNSSTESTPAKIYASGGDELDENNIALLEDFLSNGENNEAIMIISESKLGIANDFKLKLEELGATEVSIWIADNSSSADTEFAAAISNCSRFLFVDNSSYDFLSLFIGGAGVAAEELLSAFEDRTTTLAFIGDNARFTGPTIVGNYLGSYANANLSEGLNLLRNVVTIPKTYALANDGYTTLWHATNASLPYAMVKEGIVNGVWLNKENYVVFEGVDSELTMSVYGESPVGMVTFDTAHGEQVSQTYSGTGSPDKKAGANYLKLSYIVPGKTIQLGEYQSSLAVSALTNESELLIYPNPASDKLFIGTENDIQQISIFNNAGISVYNKTLTSKGLTNYSIDLNTSDLPPGFYIIKVELNNSTVVTAHFIVR